MEYITMDVPMIAGHVSTDVLRKAAAMEDGGADHRRNVLHLLSVAADEIDRLRRNAERGGICDA